MNRNGYNHYASFTRQVSRDAAGTPSTLPLNPGEGGPLPPYGDGPWTDGSDAAGTPSTLPLNPGEGGPLPPYGDGPWNGTGSGGGTPIITWPDPSNGSSSGGGTPIITWPDPSNGSSSGGSQNWNCSNNGICAILPGIIGTVWPRTARVRFLNAGYNYPAFRIFVGSRQVVNLLNYASASSYENFSTGYQTVTVAGSNGYVYIQKAMPFQANTVTTIAIINTTSGLDLLQITDSCCPPTNGYSSFRVGNLAYNSGPMDVILSDGRVVYTDLRFKEVGTFKRIRPGTYQFFYADTNMMPMPAYQDIETLDASWLGAHPTPETFGSMYLDVDSNAIYTVYLLQSGTARNNVQSLILMDR